MDLHFNKLESPSFKDALCKVWLKLTQWFLRGRFLNFVYVFLLFGYFLPLENGVALHLNNLESSSPKEALSLILFKLAQWFLRRTSLNFVYLFHYLVIISSWKRVWPFIKTNLNLDPSHNDALYQVWLKLAELVLEKSLSMYFCNFVIISPWKRVWPLIWTNMNPLYQRILYAKFG